ncbi:MAG: hypothetical protein OXH09_10880, partial [Gammaproteobacteria bacterium]|nr:hypothetical protein [Gammaproteobacteria bacterium]
MTNLEAIAGFFAPTAVFAILLLLHGVLPARRALGYAHPNTTQTPVRYRLNGLLVFAAALAIWAIALLAPLDWLWRVKWHAIAGGTALSVVLTAWMVLRAPADDRPGWVQWIEGRSRNVMFRDHVDAKMFLYVFGGILLALNVLAAAAYHVGQFGDALNVGILLHAGMWVWFVLRIGPMGCGSPTQRERQRDVLQDVPCRSATSAGSGQAAIVVDPSPWGAT